MSKILLPLALLLVSSAPLAGQQPDTTTGPRIDTRFAAVSSDSASTALADTTGRANRKVLEGAVLGFTGGAILGGFVVKLSGRSPAPTGGDVIFAGLIYGMLGSAVGAALTAATPAKEPGQR